MVSVCYGSYQGGTSPSEANLISRTPHPSSPESSELGQMRFDNRFLSLPPRLWRLRLPRFGKSRNNRCVIVPLASSLLAAAVKHTIEHTSIRVK